MHAIPHTPARQVARAFARPGQTSPHAPQLIGSVANSAHVPSHAVRPDAQVMQAPVTQARPVAHGVPQAPQWARLAWRSTSQPLAESRSQSPKPGAQTPMAHVPPTHTGVPWAGAGHARPQQFPTVVEMHPSGRGAEVSAGLPSRSPPSRATRLSRSTAAPSVGGRTSMPPASGHAHSPSMPFAPHT